MGSHGGTTLGVTQDLEEFELRLCKALTQRGFSRGESGKCGELYFGQNRMDSYHSRFDRYNVSMVMCPW